MVSVNEISAREDAVVEFIRDGFAQTGRATPRRTRRNPSGMLYLDVTNNSNGSRLLVVPLVIHRPNQMEDVQRLHDAALRDGLGKPQWVFYKDGENFFRFSANEERRGFRAKFNRSLSGVSEDERSHYMLLSKEEKFAMELNKGDVDYYSPERGRKLEALLRYNYSRPVRYTRDPNSIFASYTPRARDSTLRFMWKSYQEIGAPLFVEKGRLISAEDPNVH